MTVGEWVHSAKVALGAAGIEVPDLEAQLLAAHVLLVDRPWLIAHADETFPDLAGEAVLSRRLAQEPLAYILGRREFFGRWFSVRPGVLIPRQETEILVESTISRLASMTNPRVLDLGTGSGCIAVTLKLERPSWRLLASDISGEAIEVASQNAHDLGASVEFLESDGFARFGGESFDAIVTNPPYIGFGEVLRPEVSEFEPGSALFSGPTGFEFYERLAGEASGNLAETGFLAMELGYRQSDAVKSIFAGEGWIVLDLISDLAGIPRVLVCAK